MDARERVDVVVIGGGVAGLTAAAEVAAGGARVLLMEREIVGGQISTIEHITNAPGRTEPIAGYDLGVELLESAEAAGADVTLADVTGIESDDAGYMIRSTAGEIGATAVIVATGSRRRTLGIPGETEFFGRGVSRCASCDGPLFREQRVVVVGGGDSALDEASVLAAFAREVIVVHRGDVPTARADLVDAARSAPNIRLLPGATLTTIEDAGDGVVGGVTLGDGSALEARGVFVYVGLVPHTDWLDGFVERDETGRIVVDEALTTTRAGVFAAGDLRQGSAAMLSESAADGARAAASALAYLAARI